MPEPVNTMAVQAVAPQQVARLHSQTFATSLRLATLQQAVLAVSGGGPTFAAAQEPVADGVAYVDVSGSAAYYRPHLRVAGRPPGRRAGPDVWFLKDDEGAVTLQWTLETVPFGGDTPQAVPVPLTVTGLRMVWDGGSREFTPPGVDPVEDHTPEQAAYLLRCGATLASGEAAALESAMNHHESACRLEVTYTFDYSVRVPSEDGAGSGPIIRDHRARVADSVRLTRRAQVRPMRAADAALDTAAISGFHIMRAGVEEPASEVAGAEAAVAEAAIATAGATALRRRVSPQLAHLVVSGRISDLIARPTRTENRRLTVTRTVAFVFAPSDEQNGPIYRSLHGAANLSDQWQRGEAGWMCESVFPNTVNRLPDALRLAWNPELAGPHMIPTLHRDSTGTPRVRLLLRLAPYHDPRQRVLVRKLVAMPAAAVVIGEVEGSTMRLGGSFPEELAVVGDRTAPAPLTGLDLTLDLSLAYYQLFCQQISTPVGVPGAVDVVLDTPPPAEGQQPVPQATQIDVALRLDRVDDLPCSIALPDEAAPKTVTVTNQSGAEMTIGGAAVTLIQGDRDSAVPVDTFPGRCTTAFPLTLAAGASVDLAVVIDAAPDDTEAQGFLWNGMLVELLDKRLVSTPDAMLRHVHELAGGSDVTRDITVSSPVFSTGTLPARWASLASIEVEVTMPGGSPVSVVLSLAAPSKPVQAAVSLHSVATGAPGGITTVGFRVRNNYLDHQGAWGTPQQSSGNELIAYPNPAEGD